MKNKFFALSNRRYRNAGYSKGEIMSILSMSSIYKFIADALLVFHFLYVLFVIFGFILTWVGYFVGWTWVRNMWFRVIHVAAIGIVAVQGVVGMICPLTVWESQLRSMLDRHGEGYVGGFLQYWLHRLLYYDISLELFAVIYIVFFILVLTTLFIVKPITPRPSKKHKTTTEEDIDHE